MPHLIVKPTAYRFSSWNGVEIIYKCTICGESFSFFAWRERFCHHCGCQQDWRVPLKLSSPANLYAEEDKKIIDKINSNIGLGIAMGMEYDYEGGK